MENENQIGDLVELMKMSLKQQEAIVESLEKFRKSIEKTQKLTNTLINTSKTVSFFNLVFFCELFSIQNQIATNNPSQFPIFVSSSSL